MKKTLKRILIAFTAGAVVTACTPNIVQAAVPEGDYRCSYITNTFKGESVGKDDTAPRRGDADGIA